MDLKNREILLELLHDADDFATLKKIKCPPVYFLGGSGCILGEYLDRATFDLNFIDINYSASAGKVFRLFDRFDMLDLYVTTVAQNFEKRAISLSGFDTLEFYVLSKEDIIVSKLGRYSEKDREDISTLIKDSNKDLLVQLIINVVNRQVLSNRIKQEFIKNSQLLRDEYNV